jgi:LysM repeat protein
MQTYQHIRMCLRQYVTGSLVGKFRLSLVFGLFLFVATFIVNVPGASAQTHTTCSRGDRSYVVVRGDTLSGIGYRYDTSWPVLASYNHIVNPDLIYIDQVVCIPQHGVVNPSAGQNSTPAPKPVPTNGNSIVAMINQVFGPDGPAAINVANCESGLNPNAYNPSGAAGVFQIMPGTWAGTAQAGQSPYNAAANIAAAYQIFVRDGYSWREWTCQP